MKQGRQLHRIKVLRNFYCFRYGTLKSEEEEAKEREMKEERERKKAQMLQTRLKEAAENHVVIKDRLGNIMYKRCADIETLIN